MKIGMMSAWNQTSGCSIHAELVGRKWVEQGHVLKVFSFIEDDYHGQSLIGFDENFVKRNFGTRQITNFLNPIPFLEEDYDIFVAQDINMIPLNKLSKIFHLIRNKSKTIHVLHENRPSHNPSFYQHKWDALVCFDDRYKNFIKKIYPEEKIHIIPFPCSSWNPGNKEEARKKLDLPRESKIVFIFGQKWRHLGEEEINVFRKLSREYDLLVLITSETQRVSGVDLSGFHCIFKKEVLEREKLFQYLCASDTWLFPKRSIDSYAILSSTVNFAMGSGCVATARDSNFLYNTRDTVLHYTNQDEFENCLREAFEQGDEWKKRRRKAQKYSEDHEAGKISEQFINLFKTLAS